jgi:phosphopantetheinyl transferase (holo-ACP synthase)
MFIGNDLISLPPTRGRWRDPRWRTRICTPEEADYCATQPDPALAGLRHWAAKEAAYKVARQRGVARGFSPKQLHITFAGHTFVWTHLPSNLSGSGQWFRAPIVPYYHALAITELTRWAEVRYLVAQAPDLHATQRSAAGCRLLCRLAHDSYSHLPNDWQIQRNPSGAPTVTMADHSLLLPASLSHDGPWLAAALILNSL